MVSFTMAFKNQVQWTVALLVYLHLFRRKCICGCGNRVFAGILTKFDLHHFDHGSTQRGDFANFARHDRIPA